jgi:hypothetical protein
MIQYASVPVLWIYDFCLIARRKTQNKLVVPSMPSFAYYCRIAHDRLFRGTLSPGVCSNCWPRGSSVGRSWIQEHQPCPRRPRRTPAYYFLSVPFPRSQAQGHVKSFECSWPTTWWSWRPIHGNHLWVQVFLPAFDGTRHSSYDVTPYNLTPFIALPSSLLYSCCQWTLPKRNWTTSALCRPMRHHARSVFEAPQQYDLTKRVKQN